MKGTIYLLHFFEPCRHARQYDGFTQDLSARLESHSKGTGGRLLEVITQAGLSFQLARTWTITRNDERAIKNQKNTPRRCPRCKANQ